GIAVEANVAAIRPPGRPANPHDDTLDDVARLHLAAWKGLFHAGHNDIAQSGVALAAAAQDFDAHAFLGPGVVGNIEVRIHLNPDGLPSSFFASVCWAGFGLSSSGSVEISTVAPGALVTMRTSRQCLVFDRGRLSMISTVSPLCDSFFSS